jgi:S-DNA-T family DNA segregation ATPase FtsK/SpoIIIE
MMARKTNTSRNKQNNRTYRNEQIPRKTASRTTRSRKRLEVSSKPGIEFYSIFVICLAAVMFISLLTEHAGILGEYIDKILVFLFGPVTILAPVALLALSLGMIMKRFRGYFYKLIAALSAWLVLYPAVIASFQSPENFSQAAEIGRNYGVIGSLIALSLVKIIGKVGAISLTLVLLVALTLLAIGRVLLILIRQFIRKYRVNRISSRRRYIYRESVLTGRGSDFTEPLRAGDGGTERIRTKPTSRMEIAQENLLADDDKTYRQKVQELEEKFEVGLGEHAEDIMLPPLELLKRSKPISVNLQTQDAKQSAEILKSVLSDFKVDAKVTDIHKGPSVTLFEIQLAPGVKVQRLTSLQDDLCVALASPDIRILTPIPGRSTVGIEVPNMIRGMVTLGDMLLSESRGEFFADVLNIPLGKDVAGNSIYADIAEMPHLLIAGQTGSGKSTCLATIITSLLFKAKLCDLRFLLIDPKIVEFSVYNGLPHLITNIISDPRKAALALKWAVSEMDRRFTVLERARVKSIEIYNSELEDGTLVRKTGLTNFDKIPYILVIIDELADLMSVSAAEVEQLICRLSQKARTVGIHLIVATQRPSVNVITGLIKLNIPSRISFEVFSNVDSRVILDQSGAEKLVGKGDMLFLMTSSAKPIRVQGAFTTSSEVEAVVSFIKKQSEPTYEIVLDEEDRESDQVDMFRDELLDQAIELVVRTGHASASLLQRRFRVGYARAGRLIDTMEKMGIVSELEGSKPRRVLLNIEEWENLRNERQ